MSIEQREQVRDIMKWILYGSVSISSFLIANTYRDNHESMKETQASLKEIASKVQSIEARIIRIEYELKLK